MAKVDQSKVVRPLDSKTRIPPDMYACRIIEAEFAPSKKGNPMITLNYEIVSPETVNSFGKTVSVAGAKFQQYLVVVNMVEGENGSERDDTKTATSQGRLLSFYEAIGIDTSEFDDENPPCSELVGMVLDITLKSEELVARKDPTPEQRAANKPGDPITGSDGKPIISYRIKIDQVQGRNLAIEQAS